MYQVIGTCSNCGGRVAVPSVWFGVIPPVPTCQGCGATAAGHGPVIPMKPPGLRDGQTYTIGSGTGSGASIADWMRGLHGGGSGG